AENGATFQNVTYNFGDGSEPMVTDRTQVEHTYAEDGSYNISATVHFRVDGREVSDTSESCAAQITFKGGQPVTPVTPGQPEVLPVTGPADVVGIVSAVTIAGALAHRLVWTRRELM